jgi:hypothetical protein
MRKVSWLCCVGGSALVVTGAAVAHGGFGAKSVSAVAGTFTATTVSDARTSTCTNADGTWTRVDATYTGTAAGDPDLAGPVRLSVRALVNTTKNLGTVTGTLRIDTAGADTKASFEAVYAGGKLAGFAEGRAHDPGAKLYANVSGSYSPTGGFTNGKLGGGTDAGSAIELAAGECAQQPAQQATLRIQGTVVSASATALVVKSGSDQVSCAVAPAQAAAVTKLQAGQSVTASCSLANGAYQLVSLGGRDDDRARKRH